jgi:hypothetical protein
MCRSTFPWPRYYLQVSGQLHGPAALSPGKDPRYPLCKRLPDDTENWKFLTPQGLEICMSGRPARSQSLYRLPTEHSLLHFREFCVLCSSRCVKTWECSRITSLCSPFPFPSWSISALFYWLKDRLCGVVVRVPGYRSREPSSIPDATRFSQKQWVWNGVHSAWFVQLRSYLEEK